MSDWLWPAATVLATVVGPIVAVQAQKAIERAREFRGRKDWVFNTLMMTRAARLSPDHVRALNAIDLAFFGHRALGLLWWRQSKNEKAVVAAWHEYVDHLNNLREMPAEKWLSDGDNLFIGMLEVMAQETGYAFDRVVLKRNGYTPQAHNETEDETRRLRQQAISVLKGETAIKMDVTNLPIDPAALAAQIELQTNLSAVLSGKGSVNVSLMKDPAESA